MRIEFPSDHREDIRAMLNLSGFLLAVFLIMFFHLYRNIQMATLRYEIRKLEKEEKKLYLETEELRLKVASYSSASRIEKLYREKYGYVPVGMSQKITTLTLPTITPAPVGTKP